MGDFVASILGKSIRNIGRRPLWEKKKSGMEYSLFDPQGRRKYLVPSERIAFLRAAISVGGETATFCSVLMATGARVSETLALAPKDLDEPNGTINIETLKRRKKGVIRAVPVPQQLFHHLESVHHWRAAKRQPISAPRQRLWTFSRSTAWRRAKMIAELADLPPWLRTPKALRHAFAVDARIKEVPIELIQRCLGHARIQTTFIYTTVLGAEQRDFVRRTWEGIDELLGCAPQ
ncbi:MAG: site-specific integrase [Alphaproteobacteria bacterium]|nr:site-specific integrase [Alphaproteobacteria bacterium]